MVYWSHTTNPLLLLVTNVIRAVKINVLSYPWYTDWYTTAISQSAFKAQTTQCIMLVIVLMNQQEENARGPAEAVWVFPWLWGGGGVDLWEVASPSVCQSGQRSQPDPAGNSETQGQTLVASQMTPYSLQCTTFDQGPRPSSTLYREQGAIWVRPSSVTQTVIIQLQV